MVYIIILHRKLSKLYHIEASDPPTLGPGNHAKDSTQCNTNCIRLLHCHDGGSISEMKLAVLVNRSLHGHIGIANGMERNQGFRHLGHLLSPPSRSLQFRPCRRRP